MYSSIAFIAGLNISIISPFYISAGIGINIPGAYFQRT
jgi:hypothetical protein